MNTVTTTPAAPTAVEAEQTDSIALTFLEAVLMKDALALSKFKRTVADVEAIDIETQINVAKLLLQSENTKARSTSKRVQAAQVLGTNPPAAAPANVITPAPAGKVTATFQTTARLKPEDKAA